MILEQSLKNVFTLTGLVTTLITNVLLMGIIGLYILYVVEWQGEDVSMAFPQHMNARKAR